MTRRRTRLDASETELNMTPLIDIIFILLVFFIVTASFVKDSGVEVERPVARTAQKQKPNLVISVDSGNVIWIENHSVDVRAMAGFMSRYVSDAPVESVIVAADARSRSGVVVRVLDACRAAGIKNVSVAAKKPL